MQKLEEKVESPGSYTPKSDSEEADVVVYLKKRVEELKDERQLNSLVNNTRSIEDILKEVDREYEPHLLGTSAGPRGKRVVTDESLGLAGRMVTIGEDNWQSNQATPDFYVKVNTALAALIDQNPEAVFEPTSKKYEKNTVLAQANWKQSWYTSGGKRALKDGILNMARYGIGIWCTKPKIDIREKEVRVEYNPDDSSKDVYEKKKITRYNGLARFSLNPWDVWISGSARTGDPDSVGDWYYEKEYTKEAFEQEFPEETFKNVKYAVMGVRVEGRVGVDKKDRIRVGYYENDRKDLYCVWLPEQNIPLYFSPLPNDEGKLSLWFAQWSPRSDKSIYGIGLYEILRGDNILYDRLLNMTLDQVTLSIYKSFFHRGSDSLGDGGDGTLRITPGVGQQVSDPSMIKWLDVPGPGQDAWRSLQFIQDKRDINSGVPQQLAGKFSGKTLGQDLQAKEAALERMKLPLDYLLDALEHEAYLTLSWLAQILSTPETIEYTGLEELQGALDEAGLDESEIKEYFAVLNNPQQGQELFSQDVTPQEGVDEMGLPLPPDVKNYANVFPETILNIDQDDRDTLFESNQRKFYRFGLHLPTKKLNWKGMIKIIPQSIMSPSKELTRRLDLDLFNLIYPSIQAMLQSPQFIPILTQPIKQIIKAFDKSVKDWLDEDKLTELYEQSKKPTKDAGSDVRPSLSLQFSDLSDIDLKTGMPKKMNKAQKEVLKQFFGIEIREDLFTPRGAAGGQGAAANGQPPQGGQGQPQQGGPLPPEFSTKSGIEAPQVADIGQAPTQLSGAVEAANRI
uniref:Portal protein n=1 Tax=viral metagenome TaxID=1070528 RepID=A0A6M3XRN5_9ZZZZ